MRISDWSSDVCSSDLVRAARKPRNSNGGEGGIRTLDTVARMPHFECGAFDHSATSPSKGCQTLGANNAARLAGLVVARRELANEIPLAKRHPCNKSHSFYISSMDVHNIRPSITNTSVQAPMIPHPPFCIAHVVKH